MTTRNRLLNSVAAVLWLGLLCPGQSVFASEQLLWSDEFNAGTLPDSAVWSYDIGANGWGNNELQEYTADPANARVENGKLIISVQPQVNGRASFSSARIRTQDKLTFKYGTIEARIRIPDLADGLWPAFWTIGNNFNEVGWPACGELDIMEMGHSAALSEGVANRRVGSAAHWENGGTYALHSQSLDATADLDGDFHVFRMEWTPEGITTYVDDKKIWAMDTDCSDCSEFHEPHFVILNLAVGGNYPGIYHSAGITAPLPAEMSVDYVRIYDNGFTELGGTAVENEVPVINAGHSGAWFYPSTSGQGQFIDIEPQSRFMFLSWFTYTGAEGENPEEQKWYTAQGNYLDDTAILDLYETLGGRFDDPQTVSTSRVGEATLTFTDCKEGTLFYRFDEEERSGSFPVQRVIPGSDNLCAGLHEPAVETIDINPGMDGAWYEPDTNGQGFFVDVHTDDQGEKFIFVSWFTYGDKTASGQRWLTAQGNFEGSAAEIDIYETTGGIFDDPEAVYTIKVGTMNIDFADCETAELVYILDAEGLSGSTNLIRVVPDSQALCEEVAGLD